MPLPTASTIDPNVPATASAIDSAPVRANFAAAASELTSVLAALFASATIGYVLTSTGTGNAPTYQAPTAAQGALEKTATYTIQNADKGRTIAFSGNAFYAINLTAPSNYDTDFFVTLINIDTRGKSIAASGITTFNLMPTVCLKFVRDGAAWKQEGTPAWEVYSDVTLYVDPILGNNSGDGLAGGASAFLTAQHAVDVLCTSLKINGGLVTIQLADGTYAPIFLKPYVGSIDTGQTRLTVPTIQGNAGIPGNVVINGGVSSVGGFTVWNIKDLKVQAAGGIAVEADWGSIFYLSGTIVWGACTTGIVALYNSRVEVLVNSVVTITAAMNSWVSLSSGSIFVCQGNNTLNLNGTPAISAFAFLDETASFDMSGITTINGTCTGRQYISSGGHVGTTLQIPGSIRPLLAQAWKLKFGVDRTFFVNPATGDDANNDGLAASGTAPRGPFATPNALITYVSQLYDLNGLTLIVSCADNAGYTSVTVAAGANGIIAIQGNNTTPANVAFSGAIAAGPGARVSVAGIKPAGGLVPNGPGSIITIAGPCSFPANATLAPTSGGNINITSDYAITAGAGAHYLASAGGTVTQDGAPHTVTITGTPAFSLAFAYAIDRAGIELPSITYTGSATGTRYTASLASVINTSGGGANFFPGNGAGSTASGGQYA